MNANNLKNADLTAATEIGKYVFLNNDVLESVILNPSGTNLDEGALAYCKVLKNVENLNAVKKIGDYAFAYTALRSVDLTAAESIGKHAFLKEEAAPLDIKLGTSLKTLGDNPFAMCIIAPFCQVETTEFNGRVIENRIYDYVISDTVQVIDGSLYGSCKNGLVFITYGGLNPQDTVVAEKTVRVGSMAFANSAVKLVTLQETTFAIGHKAFYLCDDLDIVVFGTYDSPILEEEFDASYYESLQHIPGSGDYGSFTDYGGNEVTIEPIGVVPFYMWYAEQGLYHNVLYGANFIDYVGYVEDKIIMVRPVNGQMYDSFILQQYFDIVIDGAAAPDKHTLATIAAIDAIPDMVTYEDKHLVEYARMMYDKIATLEQKALVTNYSKLLDAEQRIRALAPVPQVVPEPEQPQNIVLWVILGVCALLVLAFAVLMIIAGVKAKKQQISFGQGFKSIFKKKKETVGEIPEELEEIAEEAPAEAPEEDTAEAVEEETPEESADEEV